MRILLSNVSRLRRFIGASYSLVYATPMRYSIGALFPARPRLSYEEFLTHAAAAGEEISTNFEFLAEKTLANRVLGYSLVLGTAALLGTVLGAIRSIWGLY
jgi:hypothetical protein